MSDQEAVNSDTEDLAQAVADQVESFLLAVRAVSYTHLTLPTIYSV